MKKTLIEFLNGARIMVIPEADKEKHRGMNNEVYLVDLDKLNLETLKHYNLTDTEFKAQYLGDWPPLETPEDFTNFRKLKNEKIKH